MRNACLLLAFTAIIFSACQKEMSSTEKIENSTIDSIGGFWKMKRVAIVNPVTNDTVSTYDEDFDSYIEFKADSSYVVAEQSQFAWSGKLLRIEDRDLKLSIEKETFDDFGPRTNVFNPPHLLTMRINLLTDTKAILSYRITSGDRFHYFLTR